MIAIVLNSSKLEEKKTQIHLPKTFNLNLDQTCDGKHREKRERINRKKLQTNGKPQRSSNLALKVHRFVTVKIFREFLTCYNDTLQWNLKTRGPSCLKLEGIGKEGGLIPFPSSQVFPVCQRLCNIGQQHLLRCCLNLGGTSLPPADRSIDIPYSQLCN